MIHHVPFPMRFFSEMSRILKPGGHVLIQEINASLGMRMMLRLLRHEGYSFEAPVFDRNVVCTDPNDLWSANCAIPNLLFDRPEAFERQVPDFAVERNTFSEFLLFLNSGGVIAKTVYVPLPRWCLAAMRGVDAALTSLAPSLFALQRQIVLRKR
jgi:SAM-dependent methyltransferase